MYIFIYLFLLYTLCIYIYTHTHVLCVSESGITNISDLVLESNLMADEFPNIFLRRLVLVEKAVSG